MKHINITRYTGSNHVTLVADKKNNAILGSPLQATALSFEEAEAQLKSDLSLQVEGDFDFNVVDFDAKRFTKATTEQLLKLYDKTEMMLGAREMIESVLLKRGAIQVNDDEPQEPVKGEDLQEDPQEQDEPKPAKEYKKCMTEECLQARLAEARTNYKKFCKFLCTKDKEEHFGIIRSARLDKRSGFIQYRIEIIEKPTEGDTIYTELTGRIYGKGDDSKDLTIFDTKPEEIQLSEPAPKTAPVQEQAQAEKAKPSKKASKKSTKKVSK